MKVLMVGNDSSVKGGITSVISQLLSHDWIKDGIEMTFIPSYLETNVVNKLLFFETAYIKILHQLQTNKPDVAHIHMSYRGSFSRKYLLHKLFKTHDVPDIIHLHGSEFKVWYDKSSPSKREKIRKLLRECSAIIVLGEKWDKIIKEIEPKASTVIVNNTISIPDETVNWEDPCKVLFMGMLIPRKGVADLLDAIKILKTMGIENHYKFLVAETGKEEMYLKKKCLELNVQECVEFLGWIDGERKKTLLESCQFFVLPSYNEGLPVAILEAISYGMPVVATNVGDISSAVKDGVNGFLLNPGDVVTLADDIKRLGNKACYCKMSHNSKVLASTMFSDTEYYKVLCELYKKSAKSTI